MFGCIFNTYHGAPILCCTTPDFGDIYVKQINFGTVNGMFGFTLWKPWK